MVSALLPDLPELLPYVSGRYTCTTESLIKAAERGKLIYIFAGAQDGLAARASATGIPAFPYPPNEVDLNKMFEHLRRADTGGVASDDLYRRAVLGGDTAARIQSGMSVRKIAVTSPKGGTGKTTIAVNLAVAFALSGITTYLVDADANAGALQYHLRLTQVKTTMIGLLRRVAAKAGASPTLSGTKGRADAMSQVAAGGTYLDAFTPVDSLPTLKVLPGLVTDDLGDEALQNEAIIEDAVKGLYDVGVASGGVVLMDVGINPSHPVHRAALRNAEAIAIVIKPEIPDLAETRRWIARMINSLASATNKSTALEFVGSRVKLCYNQVAGDGFKTAHKLLQQALAEDKIELALTPNGIIPVVDPRLAAQAVNTDRAEDILVWRYKQERLEELGPFVDALLGFGAHFAPPVREGAARVGLLPGSSGNGRGLFGRKRK